MPSLVVTRFVPLDAGRTHLVAHCHGFTVTPRPGSTRAEGSAASRRPGNLSLEPRIPEPITTDGVFATASSTSTGQSGGSPTGVIPPYSMSEAAVTASTGANDAFLASRCLRTSPLTSALVVAATTQAAYLLTSPRRPRTTTQFADSVSETPYRSQNAAVSASAGSISATSTSSAPPHPRKASATGSATKSSRDKAGSNDSTSLIPPSNHPRAPPRAPTTQRPRHPTTQRLASNHAEPRPRRTTRHTPGDHEDFCTARRTQAFAIMKAAQRKAPEPKTVTSWGPIRFTLPLPWSRDL